MSVRSKDFVKCPQIGPNSVRKNNIRQKSELGNIKCHNMNKLSKNENMQYWKLRLSPKFDKKMSYLSFRQETLYFLFTTLYVTDYKKTAEWNWKVIQPILETRNILQKGEK